MDDAIVTAVRREERSLVTELDAWAGFSGAASVAVWAWGRRSGHVDVAAFGRQSGLWAAIDAAVAARARRGAAKPPVDADDAREKARRLGRLTLANTGLDVGYVAIGAALARGRRRRGDGLAIMMHGLFLLWLDGRHSRRLRALTGR